MPLLTRLFDAHATILPFLLIALFAVHAYLIKQHGISPRVTTDAVSRSTAGEGDSHFSNHIWRLTGYGLALFAIVLILSLVWPAPIGQPGVAGAEVTKPWWMFVWLVPTEAAWGVRALLIVPATLAVLMALAPILDRSPYISPTRRKVLLVIAGGILLVIIASGIVGALQPISTHLK